MTTETMNVHQALAELKMMDKRIASAIQEPTWVVANKKCNTKINGVEVKDWAADVKAKYQKVMSLIRRRDAIKRAVVNSNAVTNVVVAGVTYTVAEAIDRKNTGVEYLDALSKRIARDKTMAESTANRTNGPEMETRADAYIRAMIGNTDVKGMTPEIKKMRDDFIASQTVELVDPIGAAAVIEELNDEVTAFLTNVDAALSVSNATTMITVEY